jgi:hypothetical protein
MPSCVSIHPTYLVMGYQWIIISSELSTVPHCCLDILDVKLVLQRNGHAMKRADGLAFFRKVLVEGFRVGEGGGEECLVQAICLSGGVNDAIVSRVLPNIQVGGLCWLDDRTLLLLPLRSKFRWWFSLRCRRHLSL